MSKRHKNVFEEEDEQATGAGIISLILIIAIAIALVAVILFAGGCGGVTPRPQPPPPTIAPAPPTPEPVTAPTSAGAPPWASSCNLPPSSNPNCTHSTAPDGRGIDAMWRLMQEVQADHPEFFKPKVPRSYQPGACEWVLKKEFTNAYYTALLKRGEADFSGDLCMQWDGDQLNVKYTNDFSVSFHPIRYDGDFPPVQCLSDRNGIYSYLCAGKAGF